jgi:hypothetical protein
MSATAPSHTPTVSADPQTTSYVTEAISQLLAAKDCPSKFRPLVDYLVGLAGGCTDWFEAADDEVGLNARPTAEGVSRDAACKWVQRMRKGFLEWEKKANVTFIECMPGGRDPKTKKNFKSRYKVNLLGLAEATLTDAQGEPQWRRDPRRALELVAAERADETPITPPKKPRFRPPRRDENALLQRNPKTALTLLAEVAGILAERGELDADTFVDDFAARLRDRLKTAPPCAPKVSTLKTESVDGTGGGTGGASRPMRVRCALCGEYWQIGEGHACPPKSQQIGVDTFVHPPAEAVAAVGLFESVGAHEFGVTVKDETTGRCDYDVMDGEALRAYLPGLLARNEAARESVIVRPEAERVTFWQVDDHGEDTRARLSVVAFITIETSPGNYLSYVAVADELEADELEAERKRFLARVAETGGNGGSYGAVRLPGTLNQKHDRAPRVRVLHSTPGRTVTVAELEAADLLAPPPPPRQKPPSNVVDFGAASRPWPSYEKALADAPRKANGQPDRSAADFSFAQLSFLRGKTCYDVRAKLLEVSESARTKTEHYLERTLDRAQVAVR